VNSVQGRYPDIAGFGTWPALVAPGSVQEDQQLTRVVGAPVLTQGLMHARSAVESCKKAEQAAAATKIENSLPQNHTKGTPWKPAVNNISGRIATDSPEGQKATVQARSMGSTGDATQKPTTNAVPHLEAYIIRPLCEDTYSTIQWSYKSEQLPLDDNEIQTHIRKLGSNHSVIDDVCELQPEQLRLIKIRARHRQGSLISAQFGKTVDMVTKMGTFPIKSIVFVIRTSKEVQEEEEEEKYDVNGKRIWPSLFGDVGGFGARPASTTGFGGQPGPLFSGTKSAPSSGFGAFGANAFPRVNPFSTTSSSATGNFAGNSSSSPYIPVKPEALLGTERIKRYRQKLQEDSICNYVEPVLDEQDRIQHFQAITATLSRDISFEELRQTDTEAGRTGASTGSGFLFSTDPTNQGAASKLFGQATLADEGGLFGKPSTSTRDTTSGGLFGGLTQSTKGTGGLFDGSSQGAAVSGSSSLFGKTQPASSSSGLPDSSKQPTSDSGTSLSVTAQAASSSSSSPIGALGTSTGKRKTDGQFEDAPHTSSPLSNEGLLGKSSPQQQLDAGSSGHAPYKPAPSGGGLFGTLAAQNKLQQAGAPLADPQSTPASVFGADRSENITETPPGASSSLFGKAPATTNPLGVFGGMFASRGGHKNERETAGPFESHQAATPGALDDGRFNIPVPQSNTAQPAPIPKSPQSTETYNTSPFGPRTVTSTNPVDSVNPSSTTGRFGNAPSGSLFANPTPTPSIPSPGLFQNTQRHFDFGGSFSTSSQKVNTPSSQNIGFSFKADDPESSLSGNVTMPVATPPSGGLFGNLATVNPGNATPTGSLFSNKVPSVTPDRPTSLPKSPFFNGGRPLVLASQETKPANNNGDDGEKEKVKEQGAETTADGPA
jgi:hypothetical protein